MQLTQVKQKCSTSVDNNSIQRALISLLFLQSYGWYVVFILIAVYYIKGRLEQRFNKWRSSQSHEVDLHRYDDGTILSRQQALEESRRRMQETLDAQAAAFAEQQKIKEEDKRKQKFEDWDRHVEGKGYRSKYRPQEHAAAPQPSTSSSQTKKENISTG